jgi:hypothetical protein
VSPDPDLVEKVRDLVGLYMNPPDAAAVFAVDEKPQIQALDRTAPTLPMLPTTPQRATHDYERNGTVDLFAALDIAPRHRHLRYSRQPQPRRLHRLLKQDQSRSPCRARRECHFG